MGDKQVTSNHGTCLFISLRSFNPCTKTGRGTSSTDSSGPGSPTGWPEQLSGVLSWVAGEMRESGGGQGDTHHIIHDTSTMVASLKALKKRMSSSPSEPSFFRATPNTRAKRTNPKMFIPSISVPMGICRIRGDTGSKLTADE